MLCFAYVRLIILHVRGHTGVTVGLSCFRLRDSGEKSFQVARVLFSLCSL